MAAIASPSEEVKGFLKVLGIDPKETRKVVLTIEVNAPVTVQVEKFVQVDELGTLGTKMIEYELHPKEDNE